MLLEKYKISKSFVGFQIIEEFCEFHELHKFITLWPQNKIRSCSSDAIRKYLFLSQLYFDFMKIGSLWKFLREIKFSWILSETNYNYSFWIRILDSLSFLLSYVMYVYLKIWKIETWIYTFYFSTSIPSTLGIPKGKIRENLREILEKTWVNKIV